MDKEDALKLKIEKLKRRNKQICKENHELYQEYFKVKYLVDKLEDQLRREGHKVDSLNKKNEFALKFIEELQRKNDGLLITITELRIGQSI